MIDEILYNLESKPPPESKPPSKVSPPLQCISNGKVCRETLFLKVIPRAYYPDYTVSEKNQGGKSYINTLVVLQYTIFFY